MSLRKFSINDQLTFGKHQGQSLVRIYEGTKILADSDKIEIFKSYSEGFVLKESYKNKFITLSNSFNISFTHAQAGYTNMSKGNQILLDTYGYPDYIDWCLRENDDFCLSKKDILTLEQKIVYGVKGILIKEYIYIEETDGCKVDFDIEFIERKYTFSDIAKRENKKKLKRV